MTPIIIEGRAASYARTNANKARFVSRAFDRPGRDFGEVNLCLDHSEGWVMASTRHLTGRGLPDNRLELWTDPYGLAFRASIVPTREVRDLLNGIARQECCAISIGWNPISAVDVIENGERVTIVSKASLREISIVDAGADETAFAWLNDGVDRYLRPEVEKARRGVRVGLAMLRLDAQQKAEAAPRPRIAAHARPVKPSVPLAIWKREHPRRLLNRSSKVKVKKVVAAVAEDFGGILDMLVAAGFWLDDHYHDVRAISRSAAR